MATTKNTKDQVVVVAKQLIAGTEKHLTSATPVTLLGGLFTPAQITSELQSLPRVAEGFNSRRIARAGAGARPGAEARNRVRGGTRRAARAERRLQ
jgi:hypothetical protein